VVGSPRLHVFPLVVDGAFTPRVVAAGSLAAVVALIASHPTGPLAWWSRRSSRLRLGAVTGTVILALVAIVLVGRHHDARRLALGSPVLAVEMAWVQRLADLDRDGSSSLLGGGDCAPFDPAVHPRAREVPRDGVDQNCNGVDHRPGPTPSPEPDA